jgi:hypothetical protein
VSDEPYQVDTQQHTPLRDRIATAIKEAHSELNFSLADTWDDKCLRLADALIGELGLRREWGALTDDDEGVLSDTRDDLKPWGTETIKTRWITDWQEAEET